MGVTGERFGKFISLYYTDYTKRPRTIRSHTPGKLYRGFPEVIDRKSYRDHGVGNGKEDVKGWG